MAMAMANAPCMLNVRDINYALELGALSDLR